MGGYGLWVRGMARWAVPLASAGLLALAGCRPAAMRVPGDGSQLGTTPTVEAGRLVDVGGYRLFLDCRGFGSPTVLLDAGANRASGSWAAVRQQLPATVRVCAYDRAGIGRSDSGPRPRTIRIMLQELRAALAAAGERGPYVLVGHSLGGMVAELFAGRYQSDVAGLVLIEAPAPGRFEEQYESLVPQNELPNYIAAIQQASEHLTTDELAQSDAELRALPLLPQVPAVMVRRGRPMNVPPTWPREQIEASWVENQLGLAGLLPAAKQVIAARSGHLVPDDEPHVVSQAIGEVVAAIRAGRTSVQN